VSFGSHHWPTWGNATINKFWENQRDVYRFIHDQTLRLANEGLTSEEIAEVLKLPTALDKEFYNRGYYGSVSHDAKAQYQLYFGWFDGNPSNRCRRP
jgi:alkyl sulfatase BDS1-like metallo-beta-lactamase superfamily hydrolase